MAYNVFIALLHIKIHVLIYQNFTIFIEHLNEYDVQQYLEDLPIEELIRLGQALGLSYGRLQRLQSCTKIVSAWLREEDNVYVTSGEPSWESLAKALGDIRQNGICLLYTSPSPRDATLSRMPSSA